jgi:phosphatidate phosphatase APP1
MGDDHDAVILTYRGCGSATGAFAIGRVMRRPLIDLGVRKDPAKRDAAQFFRRFFQRGLGGAVLKIRFGGVEETVTADRDGYFQIACHPNVQSPAVHGWTQAQIDLIAPAGAAASTVIDIYQPPPSATFLVISDIDDTVMHTGVANTVSMLRCLFVEGADSREAFAGVSTFYRALQQGRNGDAGNPIAYVSRAPWSLYGVLQRVFQRERFPEQPILFLREWGLTLQSLLPRRAAQHKPELLRRVMAVYPDLPVILIGDSGQRDPEHYARIAEDHPGRVMAVYILNVSGEHRRTSIEVIAQRLAAQNCSFLLASDSVAMARHAAGHGFIPAQALQAIAESSDLAVNGG